MQFRSSALSPSMSSSQLTRPWNAMVAARATVALVLWVLASIAATCAIAVPSTQAQSYKVLYDFTGGSDGGYPNGGVIRDAAGNLYGATNWGGYRDYGTIFKLTKTGQLKVLHTFKGGADGEGPGVALIRDAKGNFYGTTGGGGLPTCGCGTIFELGKTGRLTVLHSFRRSDGAYPESGVIRDAEGNLYGTARIGGAYDHGTVFELSHAGKFTVLHNFTGGTDGNIPLAGLLRDASGNLYGTTFSGGSSNYGVVFELSSSGHFKVVHSFLGGLDPANPGTPIIQDAQGNLYGTAGQGGDLSWGSVFKLNPSGRLTVLYSFQGGSDGAGPGAVIRDANGDFFGTTISGGDDNCSAPFGCGTVFKLTKDDQETVLYRFTGQGDGSVPYAGVIQDATGRLYGTTHGGGAHNFGVIFELTP